MGSSLSIITTKIIKCKLRDNKLLVYCDPQPKYIDLFVLNKSHDNYIRLYNSIRLNELCYIAYEQERIIGITHNFETVGRVITKVRGLTDISLEDPNLINYQEVVTFMRWDKNNTRAIITCGSDIIANKIYELSYIRQDKYYLVTDYKLI